LSVSAPAKHLNRLFFKGLDANEPGFARVERKSPQDQKGFVKTGGGARNRYRRRRHVCPSMPVAVAPIIIYCVGMHFLSRRACCAANPRERKEITAG